MTFIHEKSEWPQFSWNNGALAVPLAAVRHKQGKHLGKMEALGFDLRGEANLSVLTSEVVNSSAIEGETLNPEEVRSSIARRLGLDVAGLPEPGLAHISHRVSSRDRRGAVPSGVSDPRGAERVLAVRRAPRGEKTPLGAVHRRSQQEAGEICALKVEGVVEMTLDATQNFETPLTNERLFGWHASLFPTAKSGVSRITIGAWRPKEAGPMQVVSGPIGREKVHFEAPEAERLDSEMTRFLEWFNSSPAIDPVLKAGIAHFWFVTIHPFEDGNGRIARAIGDMELSRADGTSDRFYSLSSQIEAERKEYYLQLEAAQRGDLEITRWLTWFLGCLDRAIGNAEKTLAAVLRKAKLWQRINRSPVNNRQREVINRMLGEFEGFLTTSKYAKLAKCSQDTALRDIRDLLDRGIIVQNPGRGRSTSYRLSEPDTVLR